MKRNYSIAVLCFLFVATTVFGQGGVVFIKSISLDDVLSMAKKQNKNIFIDAFTKRCIPCKKLDIEFLDTKLGTYLNKNFINVKFDMETPEGKTIHKRYDVVFVPTLLILSPDGHIKLTHDNGVLSASNILSLAKQSNRIYNTKLVNDIAKTEPTKEMQTQTASVTKLSQVDDGDEKIIYVLDEHSDVPPDILYQEAYFRLELMDGSHLACVKKYLKTQDDWISSKNLQFIFDFLYDTNTEMFKYFIDHKEIFEKEFGRTRVNNTIRILTNKTLVRRIPIPDSDEVYKLVSNMNNITDQIKAYKYYLNRLYSEKKWDEYLTFAARFLEGLGNKDLKEKRRYKAVVNQYID